MLRLIAICMFICSLLVVQTALAVGTGSQQGVGRRSACIVCLAGAPVVVGEIGIVLSPAPTDTPMRKPAKKMARR